MVNTSCWVEGGVVSNWARGRLLLSRGGYVYVLFLFDDTAPTEIYTLSLHDALPIFMLDFQAARWLMEKDVAKQAGNNHPTSIPTGVFKTSDGYINIATTGGRIWERCAQAIGAPELVTNPDYATAPARSKNRDALNVTIGKLTVKKSTENWVKELNEAGVPCGPIYSIDQMFEDAQVKHLGIAQHVPNDENRHIQLVGQPVTLSRTPSSMAARPPEFGEQTEEVLAEFGFASDEIAELRQGKVV